MSHGLIHFYAHLIELGNHILNFRLVFLGGFSHHLGKFVQIVTDFPGIDEAVPHGFLDFFITKHVVQGIRNAFHFFQHLAGIGHKLVDISAGLAGQTAARFHKYPAVLFRRAHIHEFFPHHAVRTDGKFRFLGYFHIAVDMHGDDDLVRFYPGRFH